MKKSITTRQLEILTFIRSFAVIYGYLPTVREIGEGVGLKSTSSIHSHMQRLVDLGYIERVESVYSKSGHSTRYKVKDLRYVIDEDRSD